MREHDFILGADLLTDGDFADIIEFVPIFIKYVHIPVKRLGLMPAWNGHVQCFHSEECIFVEEVTVIVVRLVGEESVAKLIEIGHDWKQK